MIKFISYISAFLITMIVQESLAQSTYEGTYILNIDTDRYIKALPQDTDFQVIQLLSNAVIGANDSQFNLLFSEKKSLFSPIETLDVDNSKTHLKNLFLVTLDIEQEIYNFKNENKVYKVVGRENPLHLISFCGDPKYNWEITSESKVVMGYRTLMAKGTNANIEGTGIEIEVWFIPEMSYPFGPGYFYGLPGLISEVKYSDPNLSYNLTLTHLIKKAEVKENIIELPEGLDILTKLESEEFFSKAMSNFRQ